MVSSMFIYGCVLNHIREISLSVYDDHIWFSSIAPYMVHFRPYMIHFPMTIYDDFTVYDDHI